MQALAGLLLIMTVDNFLQGIGMGTVGVWNTTTAGITTGTGTATAITIMTTTTATEIRGQ